MRTYRHILAAIDPYEDAARAVLSAASAMAQGQQARITVASAYLQPAPVYPHMGMGAASVPVDTAAPALPPEVDEAEAVRQRDRRVRELLEEMKLDADVRVPVGPPGEAVPELAEELGADLIVLGSHHRGFLDRLFAGSVSRQVASEATCDVLLVAANRT